MMSGPAQIVLRKIISGGQTGVDRGALDAAIELGLEHGGWCPMGRIAEDQFIPARYVLRQTDTKNYAQRTEKNVQLADGTLILHAGPLSGGTFLTHQLCQRYARPVLLVDLARPYDPQIIRRWLAKQRIVTLNVAGPRESLSPGIEAATRQVLLAVLQPVTIAADVGIMS
jgi:hypothetical protein